MPRFAANLTTMYHEHPLLERFAEAIARILLDEFHAPSVKVRVAKLAPITGVREIGVMIERSADKS